MKISKFLEIIKNEKVEIIGMISLELHNNQKILTFYYNTKEDFIKDHWKDISEKFQKEDFMNITLRPFGISKKDGFHYFISKQKEIDSDETKIGIYFNSNSLEFLKEELKDNEIQTIQDLFEILYK